MGFLYAPACERSEQFLCPPNVPIAIRPALKAGSRATVLWASMIEGIWQHLVTMRRTLTAELSESSQGSIWRFLREWIEHEEMRLGCSRESTMFSMTRTLHL